MFNFAVHRNFITLGNGVRLLLRPLIKEDLDQFRKFFADASPDDVKYLKNNVKDPRVAEKWIEYLNYDKVLPLVACRDAEIVGDCSLHVGEGASRHTAEVRIFLAHDYRGIGLGSKMINEMCAVGKKLNLSILKAEVVLDQARVVEAFSRLGFDLRCTLHDYFMRVDGETHDVALMIKRLSGTNDYTF